MMCGGSCCWERQRHGWHQVRDYGAGATARVWRLPSGRWAAEVERPFDHPARYAADFASRAAAQWWADRVAITGDDLAF